MVGYFVGLLGFGAVAASAWSYQFWRVFTLGLVGAIAIVIGAHLAREIGYADTELAVAAAATGVALMLASFFGRRLQWGLVALVGSLRIPPTRSR